MQEIHQEATLLADELAAAIRDNIHAGVYPQGSPLRVRRLCEEFGTSETPVKQALNQLLATGLVVSKPKCGMSVAVFRPEDMRDNLEARMMIELYAVDSAIARVREDPSYARELRELLDRSNEEYERCARRYTRENFNGLYVRDRALHQLFVSSLGNAQILRMYQQLNAHAMMFVGFDSHCPLSLRNVIREHTAIVDALLSHDERALREAIRRHIDSTIGVYSLVSAAQDAPGGRRRRRGD